MTKSDLIKHVAVVKNLSKGRAEALVNCVFADMVGALGREERVEIRGLGSFEVRHYGAYQGRDPRTGDPVAVLPKRLPFFRPASRLKESLNPRVTRTQELPAVGAETKVRRAMSRSA
jgi:integration host factor subunit beta